MDPEGNALSEMSDKERQMPYNLSYMRNTYNQAQKYKRTDWWLPQGGGEGWEKQMNCF